MDIRIDDLSGEKVKKLLAEHHQDMLTHSPPESVHALDFVALQSPDITFWSAWVNSELVGCVALKELDSTHGEIKSMRTSVAHLRKGLAAKMLAHILKEAGNRSYQRVSLETGSMEVFIPARKLYQTFGFKICPPFSTYQKDPYSVFMTKKL